MSDDVVGGDRFRIVRKLGAGGMGEVYEARDDKLDRTVALKKLPSELADDPDRRRRLLEEARHAARVTDPGIAALYDVVEDDADVFLVMEHVDGTPLSHLRDKLTRPRVLDVARQMADALASAHGSGIIHGDVKPSNVMLTRAGRVKILDFGVSRVTADALEEMTTAAGEDEENLESRGLTPAYASPEALRGEATDPRSDLFSLGIVLYELLAGRHPFAADTWVKVAGRILADDPVPLRKIDDTLSPDLERIVARLLAKDPDDRYPGATALRDDLDALRTGTGSGAPASESGQPGGDLAPPSPGRQRLPPGRRAVFLVIAVAAILALAYGGSWLFFEEWAVPDRERRAVPTSTSESFDASDWIIAVLPSTTAEQASEDVAALNRGLATTLTSQLTQLSRTHALQVVPASTLQELELDGPQELHRELGVTLVLDFHTQIVDDDVLINTNLVDVRRQRQLAADTVDGALGDLLALQQEVGERVTHMLRLELEPAQRQRIAPGTTDPGAYAAYIRGRGYLENYTEPADAERAASLFEKAVSMDPDFGPAHAGLGLTLWRLYENTQDASLVERALAECEEAIALAPEEASGFVCRGTLLSGTGRYAEAVTAFNHAVELEPTLDRAYRGLADSHLALGRVALAEETYKEAIDLRPHYWRGYNSLGILYFRLGRYEEAAEQFEQVVRLAPNSHRGYSNLGAAAFSAERWQDARRAFETALEIDPGDPNALSNLGTLAFYEGDYQTAARRFDEQIESTGGDYIDWGNLADAYYWGQRAPDRAEGAYREAIELARKALDVNPKDAAAMGSLALYEVMVGESDAGLEHARQALELSPDAVMLRVNLARAYCVADRRDRCLELVREAVTDGAPARVIRADPAFRSIRGLSAFRELTETDPEEGF